jgi:hypothetical protein
MSVYVSNFYQSDTFQANNLIVASSSPYDGISTNILWGTRLSDIFYGESGSNLFNAMDGLRGDDIFYGGVGLNTDNGYVGGAGVDKVFVGATSASVGMKIDYQGGLELRRPDGGTEWINSEVEIIQFQGGNKFFNISAGIDDTAIISNSFFIAKGDRLVISNDWLAELNSGNVAINTYDANKDGTVDTVLSGGGGVNSYTLLNYDLSAHPNVSVVSVYGEGILYDLG